MSFLRNIPVVIVAATLAVVSATTLEQLSLDDMLKKSTSVVRGQVVSSAPLQRGTVIYTSYRLQVTERLKGDGAAVVEVAVPGGRFGQLRQTIPGAPVLEAGKEYVVFIWTGPSGTNHILGLSQGLFDVRKGANGELILQRTASDARMLDRQGREVEDQDVTISFRTLRQKLSGGAAR